MIELLQAIYRLPMAPVSAGTDRCVELLAEQFPCTVHEYAAGADHNGWVIPKKWAVIRAEIRKNGALVYDGTSHPLGVIGYSDSFHGSLGLAELKEHLYTRETLPDALVYHWELYYRHGRSDWGFSVPHQLFESLVDGEYEVDLETVKEDGTLKVADFHLPGDSGEEIILNAHNCHAGQANDDTSGIVVGIELMRRLAELPRRRYGYRLLVTPELYGTLFWLRDQPPELRAAIKGCLLLKAVGNRNSLALQHSFTGNADIDRAAQHYLKWHRPDHRAGPFREIYGNDETVFEAPGFEIPTITLTRVEPIPSLHYPEYHTSADDMSVVSEDMLEDTAEAALGIFEIIERDAYPRRDFEGLLCLSNRRYDLYIDAQDPAVRPEITVEQRKWYMLMTCLPRYLDGGMSVLDIAERHELPFEMVHRYLCRFGDKGLIHFDPDAAPGI